LAVSVKTRVLVWGRAGGRCSFEGCGQELIEDATVADEESLVGDIAHIVAESPDGPRGISPLPIETRAKYVNLMLLCKRHHKIVDDQQTTYTAEVLRSMKSAHEARVRAALPSLDRLEQHDREIYASYVEHWQDAIHLNHWQDWTSWLMQAQPSLELNASSDFRILEEWILSRIWPRRYPELEAAFSNFTNVLIDLTDVFMRHSSKERGLDRIWMRRFYRDVFDKLELPFAEIERESARMVAKYEYHTDLICDLTLELTRAANYICDHVRTFVDPVYRMSEGVLLVTSGLDTSFRTCTYRAEYRGYERILMPYPGLQEFEERTRATRDFNYGPRESDRFDLKMSKRE
jgi:hypothetical protein